MRDCDQSKSAWLERLATLALLGVGIGCLTAHGIVGLQKSTVDRATFGRDFGVMYAGGRAWLDGVNPYDPDQFAEVATMIGLADQADWPFSYPPHSAALFMSLAKLTLPQAKIAWLLLNLTALLGTALLLRLPYCRTLSGRAATPWWLRFVAVLIGIPVTSEIVWSGQTSLIACAALLASWELSRIDNWLAAGLCVAIASLKPQLCLPVVLWLILEGRWKCLFAATVAAILGALPLLQFDVAEVAGSWVQRLGTHRDFFGNRPGFDKVLGLESLFAAIDWKMPHLEIAGLLGVALLWFYRRHFTSTEQLATLVGLSLIFGFCHDYDLILAVPLFVALHLQSHDRAPLRPALLIALVLLSFPSRPILRLQIPLLGHWRTMTIFSLLATMLIVARRDSTKSRCDENSL